MQFPKLSIITVCYNLIEAGRKEYFLQMFDSLHNQTYSNIEHVLIDGASTDGTVELIQELIEGKESIVFISEEDRGIYDAMNKGIEASSGEYLSFMNTDDYYCTPFALAELMWQLGKHKKDIATGSIYILDEKANRVTFSPSRVNDFLSTIPMNHNTMIIKKRLFKQYGTFDEQYKILADIDFMMRVILAGVPILEYNKKPLIYFRKGGISSVDKEAFNKEYATILYSVYRKHTNFSDDKIKSLLLRKRPIRLLRKILFLENKTMQKGLLRYYFKKYLSSFLRFRFVLSPLERGLKMLKR